MLQRLSGCPCECSYIATIYTFRRCDCPRALFPRKGGEPAIARVSGDVVNHHAPSAVRDRVAAVPHETAVTSEVLDTPVEVRLAAASLDAVWQDRKRGFDIILRLSDVGVLSNHSARAEWREGQLIAMKLRFYGVPFVETKSVERHATDFPLPRYRAIT